MVNLFAAATVLATYLALTEPRWLIAASAGLTLAVLSKASGLPPIALLGARGVELVAGAVGRWRYGAALLCTAVLGCFFHHHGSQYLHWWKHRTYAARDTSRAVRQIVGERRAVVVGIWAPWLVFDTPYENYIVRPPFNVDKKTLGKLRPTHLLLKSKDIGRNAKRAFPERYKKRKKLETFDVYREQVTLYELPLGGAADASLAQGF